MLIWLTIGMEVIDVIKSRRSIRKYKKEDIPNEKILKILDAARHAPSASNIQPWEFIVVRDKATKEKLSKVNVYGKFIADAPVAVVVIGDESRSPGHWVEDCSLAVENMFLAAKALGIGGCWVAVFSLDSRGLEREKKIKEVLGIPEKYRVLCVVALGYPDEEPTPRNLRELNELIHYEKF
ncbi:nitroreductase family protein [archaeon]|nr:nitroreductase family protein [archaeon]NHV06309.1 nitroreductase family protein [Nitrososphaerota archaeon]